MTKVKKIDEKYVQGLGKFHRYDEQLRVRAADALIVDLRATLQEPYASAVAAEIEKRWNSHEELLVALGHALTFLESLPSGWLSKTTGDIAALNDFYLTAPKAIKKAKGVI